MIAGPALISYGIDQGVSKGDVDVVTQASLLFVVAAAGAYVLGRAAILGVARIGEAFLLDVRERVFHHIMDLSMGFFDRTRTGLLVSRMTADVEALQDLVGQGLAVFLVSVSLIVGTMVAMLLLSWQLALITLSLMPVLLVATIWFRRASSRAYLRVRDRVGGTLTALQEGLAGVRVIQAFDQTDRTVTDFTGTSREQYLTSVGAERIAAIYVGIVELVQGVAFALIIGLGAYFASEGDVTVGVVTAFVLYINNLFEPIQQLTQVFNSLQQAGAALKKLYGLLDEEFDLVEPAQPVELPVAGDLVVDNVSFQYAAASRSRAARRVAHAREREAARARRPDWRRQVHPRQVDGSLLRPDQRLDQLRRRRPAQRRRSNVAEADRRHPPRGLPVHRHDPRQPADGVARRRRSARARRARRPRALLAVRRVSEGTRNAGRDARHELLGGRTATRVGGARPGSSTRRCSCSTRRRRASIPAPSCSSTARSSD